MKGRFYRKSSARRAIRLLLRREGAQKVMVVERRDDERMIREPRIPDDPIDPGFAGKVGNVKRAAADCFYVRQCGPNDVFHARIARRAYRCSRLLEFVGTFFPEIGDQEEAMSSCKCSVKCAWPSEIGFDHFVREIAMC